MSVTVLKQQNDFGVIDFNATDSLTSSLKIVGAIDVVMSIITRCTVVIGFIVAIRII